ncbi:MAG TPA: hypothetical protein VHG08_17155 [Longimicrobium sp.]|nr:hypothetical protein [Longimicrobium sp.]
MLVLAGCDGSPSGSAARECGGGPVRLEPGDAVEVATDAGCELRPQDGAEYALAYYDARFATAAQNAPEPYSAPDERFAIILREGDGQAGASSSPRLQGSPAAEPPHDFQWSFAPGPPRATLWPAGGDRAWSPGDLLRLEDTPCTASCAPPVGARVARVMDGWLVLALDEASLGAEAARVAALFDEAAPLLRQHAIPLLTAVLSAERPVTTTGSGQLVVLFQGDVTQGGGVAFSQVGPGRSARHWIRLELAPGLDAVRMLSLLAHEITHTFQYEFVARSAPAEGAVGATGAARWGIEGGATLIESETVLRAAGLGITDNLDFRAQPTSPLQRHALSYASGGPLVVGYEPAAEFLRDLVVRRMAAGETAEQAYREVARGAAEGWYGVAVENTRRPGLVSRMRARMAGWDPVDAVLTWALSAAADDRLEDPAYQNRTWLRLRDPGTNASGWGPDRVIDGGSGATETWSRLVGVGGYLLMRDTGRGISFRVTAPASVRWRLLRIQ